MLDAALPPVVSPPNATDGRRRGVVVAALIDPLDDVTVVPVGVALAEEHGARLTLAGLWRRVPFAVSLAPFLAPWTVEQLHADALAETAGWCQAALRRVPMSVGADHRVLGGRPSRALEPLIEDERVQVVVLPEHCRRSRAVRRAARGWTAAGVDVRFAAPTTR